MSSEYHEYHLLYVYTALTNAVEDPFIREALVPYKYDGQRMGEGRRLYETAEVSYKNYLDGKVNQAEAWRDFKEKLGMGNKELAHHRDIARLALREHQPLRNSLGLTGRVKLSLSGLMDQARLYYANALDNPVILKNMERFGVTKKNLKEADKRIDEIEQAAAFHKQKKAETQQALKKRKQAFKAMDDWMKDFWKICRIALADHPAQLKKLKLKR
ncbi:MAG: hypothetical protein GY940_41730 [bacterium]|nr:hypothetical protein [bacterium]